jgi:hypothetical protein
VENIVHLYDTFVDVSRFSLSPFAETNKAKVIQLATQGRKGGMVEITREDVSLNINSVMHDYLAQNILTILAICIRENR